MPTLLHISASPRGDASHSRKVGHALVEHLGDGQPTLRVVVRDLAHPVLPHLDRDFVEASLMREEQRRPQHLAALSLSETLVDELERADLVVIDTPIHNFTVPSSLKAWIDHVVRPNRTFRHGPSGKVGMLRDRPVYLVAACGGSFQGGPGGQTDFMTPYLRYVLGVIGISSIETLLLENLNRGKEQLDMAMSGASQWIGRQKWVSEAADIRT